MALPLQQSGEGEMVNGLYLYEEEERVFQCCRRDGEMRGRCVMRSQFQVVAAVHTDAQERDEAAVRR